uniref:uncharacterized protein LOC131101404 isoform X5 n=1 Tax=Doryrhamphus excisus TaxID=161450 RepID=UPI0025ADB7E6|nr:uncharacterized protein LOC131101404 isoform X5 [Doryrhamphus excisus]
MSPRNLILVSLLVVLVPPVSAAPMEEHEEAEPTEEVEGEQSEEEEDDDDSTKEVQETQAAFIPPTPPSSPAGPPGAPQTAGGASGMRPHVPSTVHGSGWQDGAAGGHSDGSTGSSGGSDAVDSYSNGNGQKLLNGRGGAEGQTGVLMSLEGGASPLEHAGTVEAHLHHFLLDLLGRTPTSMDATGSLMDARAISQSPSSPHSSHDQSTARQDSSSFSSPAQQTAGSQLMDTDGVSARPASFRDLHAHSVPWAPTGTTVLPRGSTINAFLHLWTASVSRHRDSTITGSSPVVTRTELADGDLAHTPHSGTHTWRTDTVTMATAPSAVQVTEDFHKAGSVTEQYNPWSQGPEGEVPTGLTSSQCVLVA